MSPGPNLCPDCQRSLANVEVCQCGYSTVQTEPRPDAMQAALAAAREIGRRSREKRKP